MKCDHCDALESQMCMRCSTALGKLCSCHAAEALDIFLAIIGAEAANMALRGLSSGGVYIAGGIIPKVSKACWRCWPC